MTPDLLESLLSRGEHYGRRWQVSMDREKRLADLQARLPWYASRARERVGRLRDRCLATAKRSHAAERFVLDYLFGPVPPVPQLQVQA